MSGLRASLELALVLDLRRPAIRSRLGWLVMDSVAMAKRSLVVTTRRPDIVVFAILQPVMFVLVFRYVFGGAVRLPHGFSYVNYLMAGIAVQTMAFNTAAVGMGFAADRGSGMVDRFRSVPMSRTAILLGRVLGNLVRNVITVVVLVLLGLIVGFRPHLGVDLIYAFALLTLFGFALSWVGAAIGMAVSSQEAAQSAGFVIIWPLIFASSAFVPPSTMPSGLREFVENQPLTHIVDAERSLFLHQPVGSQLWLSIVWCVGIGAVFALLSARTFARLGRVR
jgi:ABC transporter DrrB family efflux protein